MVVVVIMGSIFILCSLFGFAVLYLYLRNRASLADLEVIAQDQWRLVLMFIAVAVISVLLAMAFIYFAQLFGFKAFVPGVILTSLAVPAAMIIAGVIGVLKGLPTWLSFAASWLSTNVGINFGWFFSHSAQDPWSYPLTAQVFLGPMIALVLAVVAVAAALLEKVNRWPEPLPMRDEEAAGF